MSLARPEGRRLFLRSALAWTALVVFETTAQASLKAAGEALSAIPFGWNWTLVALGDPWALLGLVGYLGAFVAWMAILDRMPLSKGFPMTSVIGLAVVATSVLAFGETVGPVRALGIALILVGLAVMGNADG